MYRDWPASLGDDVEVVGVQLPGRETRMFEPPLDSVTSVVTPLVADIHEWLDRPFALFGHSMGALLAFELARVLQKRGSPPLSLAVSAFRAPHRPGRRRRVVDLHDEELLAELGTFTTTRHTALAHADFARLILPTLRADIRMCEAHVWRRGAPLSCPILAFGGRHDHTVSRSALEDWARHTASDFQVRLFAGDHFYLDGSRHLVARSILKHLKQRARQQSLDCMRGSGSQIPSSRTASAVMRD
jgi:medium-chain acyl-[acyl-carrier-protein] hydrolase